MGESIGLPTHPNPRRGTPVKILIAYYSLYGHIFRMAKEAAAAVAEVRGAEPVLRRVQEFDVVEKTIAQNDYLRRVSESQKDIPVATLEDVSTADGYFFGSPTTMLIRSDLIRKRIPFYNPVNLHADEESCYDILQESDYGFVHQVLAYFRKHERSQTAQALDFDTSILAGRVYALAKYGRVYLSEEEFRRRSRERLREFYSALANATLRLRDKKFSQYCRTELAMLGMSLDGWRLVRAVLWRVTVLVSNPGESVNKLRTRVADRFAKRGSPRHDPNGWKRGQ